MRSHSLVSTCLLAALLASPAVSSAQEEASEGDAEPAPLIYQPPAPPPATPLPQPQFTPPLFFASGYPMAPYTSTETNSPIMRDAGVVVTVLGGIIGTTGMGIAIDDLRRDDGEWGDAIAIFLGVPVMGLGGIFCAVGVPLIVNGGKPVRKDVATTEDVIPRVDVAPGGVRASWTFQ